MRTWRSAEILSLLQRPGDRTISGWTRLMYTKRVVFRFEVSREVALGRFSTECLQDVLLFLYLSTLSRALGSTVIYSPIGRSRWRVRLNAAAKRPLIGFIAVQSCRIFAVHLVEIASENELVAQALRFSFLFRKATPAIAVAVKAPKCRHRRSSRIYQNMHEHIE